MQNQLTQTAAAAATAVGATAPTSDFDRLLQRSFTPQDLMQGDNLDRIDRIAERMASGRMTVPEYLRGNIGDCMAIAIQAMLWNMDPFAVAQKTHIVSGRLGFEAQLVNAVLQNSGAVRGLPRYEYRGEGSSLECRVGFVPRGETDVVWNEFLKISDITTKNSPLWKVNPKQQLGYLQVKNWARAYCPGAILGVYTVDELEDNLPLQPRAAAPAPAQAEAQTWPKDNFDKQLPRWTKAVVAGLKSVDEILTLARSKGALTPAQEDSIRAIKAPAPAQDDESDSFVDDMNAAEAAEEDQQ